MWAEDSPLGCRLGFSGYAVRLLGDVTRLEWSVDIGQTIRSGEQIGFIEGSKATSDLYAPVSGLIAEINEVVLARPTLINSNLYDDAWLILVDHADLDLLDAEAYTAHLQTVWPVAQRLLKGQAGRS